MQLFVAHIFATIYTFRLNRRPEDRNLIFSGIMESINRAHFRFLFPLQIQLQIPILEVNTVYL